MKSIYFDDSMYEWAHGRAPRGRGNWAFLDVQFDRDVDIDNQIFWYNGTFSEAKRAARVHFSALGVTDVLVLS